MAGSDEISKKLWHISDDYSIDPKVRIRALALLSQANDKRHDRLISGRVDYLRTKQNLSDIQDFASNNPELKASIDMEKLLSRSYGTRKNNKNSSIEGFQEFMNRI